VAASILHVSDLHAGTEEEPDVEAALAALAARVEPELVVASGDLTHRGRREQHARAARLLRSLGPPVLAVPGNHDLPYTFPKRFTQPWAEFEREWTTTEPTYSSKSLHVVGLNSARPFRQQGGALRREQLEGAAVRLRAAPPGALRVAVLHHHLIGAPWRAARKRPVSHRGRVLGALVDAGAELVLAGHIHQSAVAERREFAVLDGDDTRMSVAAIAPGLGRPRPHRLGEARGLQHYEASERALVVRTYVWRGGDWAAVAERSYARG